MSARYSIVDEEYYEPEVLRGQSAVNHQGSEGVVELDDELNRALSEQYKHAFKLYEQLLEKGVCREQARGVLPQSTYTSFVWKNGSTQSHAFLTIEDGSSRSKRDP